VADTPLVAALKSGMRDHVRAFEQQLDSLESLEKKVVDGVVEAINRSFKKHLEEKPVSRMTDEEVRKAVLDAVTTAAIRSNHGPVLNNVMKMLSQDKDDGDTLTTSFPPVAQMLDTVANDRFKMVVLGIIERMWNASGTIPIEKQKHILKGKTGLVIKTIDRVDVAAEKQVRSSLTDPRCKACKIFYRLFAYYLIHAWASMNLKYPDEDDPAVGEAAGSNFFSATQSLRATCSGLLPVGDTPAPKHKLNAPPGSPLAGVHDVTRNACLYDIVLQMLYAIVGGKFDFDPAAVCSGAKTLRTLLLSPDRSWIEKPMKDAEEEKGPCVWTLMLPRSDGRADLDTAVQMLKPAEQREIKARSAPVGSAGGTLGEWSVGGEASASGSMAEAAAGAGGGSGAVEPTDVPAWLRAASR